jgi:hypothetical protein
MKNLLEEFEKATVYLQDRSTELAAYIPVPPLLKIVKDYYCSRLLFENALFAVTKNHDARRVMADLIVASTNDAVVNWKQHVLRLQADFYAHMNGIKEPQQELVLSAEPAANRLSRILTWSQYKCCRPCCWYAIDGCNCRWPLRLIISPES